MPELIEMLDYLQAKLWNDYCYKFNTGAVTLYLNIYHLDRKPNYILN